jgi:hypothetical protein
MPTMVRKLDRDEEHETLRDLFKGPYLEGECYAFAIALHQGLGWPMLGLMNKEVVRHVAVRSPDGKLFDARGFVLEEQFGRPFSFAPPYDLSEVTLEDLVRKGESNETRAHSVRSARRVAELLWPELPWKDSLALRAYAFANELEALSRKHKFWIRAPVPADPPVLAVGEDDEGGYELCPTMDGFAFTINRYFPSH